MEDNPERPLPCVGTRTFVFAAGAIKFCRRLCLGKYATDFRKNISGLVAVQWKPIRKRTKLLAERVTNRSLAC